MRLWTDHVAPSRTVVTSRPLHRSSLGEYHKDSRNLKRVKDTSESPVQTILLRWELKAHPLAHCFPIVGSTSGTDARCISDDALMMMIWTRPPLPCSPALPSAETHTAQRGGVPERAAQDAARHRLLQRGREHLHSTFCYTHRVHNYYANDIFLWFS